MWILLVVLKVERGKALCFPFAYVLHLAPQIVYFAIFSPFKPFLGFASINGPRHNSTSFHGWALLPPKPTFQVTKP